MFTAGSQRSARAPKPVLRPFLPGVCHLESDLQKVKGVQGAAVGGALIFS